MTIFDRIQNRNSFFAAPRNGSRIRAIDMHTGGEPLRVILAGVPDVPGCSVLERRRHLRDHLDQVRTQLMFEPRGHADMYGCLLVPPNDDDADFGIIFLHNEGYSTMCGHAIIAISTLAAEMEWIEIREGINELRIDAPCGRIVAFIEFSEGRVVHVQFDCVPSFVVDLDQTVQVPTLGSVTYDLAYGGAFYAYVDLQKNDLDWEINPESIHQIISAGRAIKRHVQESNSRIVHPFEPDLSFLYGTIFVSGSPNGFDSRNVCVFADGEVDRCPTGSGVSGRMAIHHRRGELAPGDEMTIESLIGSVFTASYRTTDDYGPFPAVIPRVQGSAFVTGESTFYIDEDDPLKNGFLLR